MENIERIKQKIAKLMNLAEKATNEHEAASAAAKARALMDAHDLSQIDIAEVNGMKKEFATVRATRAWAAMPKWMATLAVSVAIFNDCTAVYERDTMDYKMQSKINQSGTAKVSGKVIVFRGFKNDAEMAADMFARLCGAINGLCVKWLEESGHTGKFPVGLSNNFKLGAAHTIGRSLKEAQTERMKLTAATGTSLVVVKMALVEEHFGAANYKTGKSSKMDDRGYEAYDAGRVRGNQVEVQRKLED